MVTIDKESAIASQLSALFDASAGERGAAGGHSAKVVSDAEHAKPSESPQEEKTEEEQSETNTISFTEVESIIDSGCTRHVSEKEKPPGVL